MTINGEAIPTPRPIPDLTLATPGPGISDEDRNRYGVLLDHAAERGLFSSADYQLRLTELAEATSVEELQRIVTELPAFDRGGSRAPVPSAPPGPKAVPAGYSDRPIGAQSATAQPTAELDAALWASLTPAIARKDKGNPWVILAIVVVIFVVAMVGLALVAAHVGHTHAGAVPGAGAAGVSRLRL